MHCHLRLPDSVSVVLGFNHTGSNAPALQIQQLQNLREAIMHPLNKFQQNQTIHCRVIAI